MKWGKLKWKENSEIPRYGVCVDRISIYADIILKSFYFSAKVQLSKSLLWDVEGGKGWSLCGATELKGSLSLFYVHKINLILFVLLLLHHANIKFIFRERSDIWKLPPRNRAYTTGPRFLHSPLSNPPEKSIKNFLRKEKQLKIFPWLHAGGFHFSITQRRYKS